MTPEDRCTDLEIKYSRQELLLEELSSVLYAQQKMIDHLEKGLATIKDQLANPTPEIGPPNEIPPHY